MWCSSRFLLNKLSIVNNLSTKNMGKTANFSERPKPPDKEKILQDLKIAADDDIIFSELKTQTSPVPVGLSPDESYAELNTCTLDKSEENGTTSDATQFQDHVNATYRQVKRLIQLHSQLAKEPELLQEKYENLKDLGEDVSDSIADLKQAAEKITKKS